MASRTVTSPAGDSIEIVSDNDWVETAGVNSKSLKDWGGTKRVVIRELWERGSVHEPQGRAGAVLYERVCERFPDDITFNVKNLAHTMNVGVNAPAFEREIRGKRCFSIGLAALPESWYRKLTNDIGERVTYSAIPVNGAKANLEPLPPDPFETIYTDNRETLEAFERGESIPIEEPSPVIEVEIASQVAMELLTAVVEIISTGSGANGELIQLRKSYEHSQATLSERLTENERLRRQLRETGDELHSVKSERDGLRTRLRQTEANLSAALKGETAAAVTGEVMKRVDRIMRTAPETKKGNDNQ